MRRPPTIYLAGPILGCTDEEVNGWRQGFMGRLPTCGFLDPMRRDYRGREAENADVIVEEDKEDIDASDVLLAYCWQASWGTGMEIHYAWSKTGHTNGGGDFLNVVVVIPEGITVSPWLIYHSHVVVKTLEEAAAHIKATYEL